MLTSAPQSKPHTYAFTPQLLDPKVNGPKGERARPKRVTIISVTVHHSCRGLRQAITSRTAEVVARSLQADQVPLKSGVLSAQLRTDCSASL